MASISARAPRNPRRSPADHQNPVTTTHLPGGEPEYALNDQVRSLPEGENTMTSVIGTASTGVAA
jgi:hypothetical protein